MKLFYKTADILLKLREKKMANISEVMKETDMTYSYVYKCIKSLENKGCVVREFSDDKRERLYKLTKKGEKVADAIETIISELKIWKK